MEKTTGATLTDFCLVLAPDENAAGHAIEAVRMRFKFLADDFRAKLVAAVAKLVEEAVENSSGSAITVTIALELDAIRGVVSDQGEPGLDDAEARFEIPLG
jgi:hypothetical protein